MFFNVYVDGLSDILNGYRIGCCTSGVLINHLMYADDVVLLAPSVSGLQKLIRACENYGLQHDIKFNPKKSAVMLFKAVHFRADVSPHLELHGEAVRVTHSTRYLGHIFCDDFTDDNDIGRQCRTLYAQGNTILRKFYMCSLDVKLKMFKSYCMPLYTAHLWLYYRKGTINRMYTAYHNIFKLIMGFSKFCSTSLMCTIFDVPSCAGLIRKLIYRFCLRLENSENLIVNSFNSSDLYFSSGLRNHWIKLLVL